MMSNVSRDIHSAMGEPLEDWGPENKYPRTMAYVGVVFLSLERRSGCLYSACSPSSPRCGLIAEHY